MVLCRVVSSIPASQIRTLARSEAGSTSRHDPRSRRVSGKGGGRQVQASLMMPLAWFISRGTQTVGIRWACGANLNRDKHPVPHCR
jgi:hypothetical protein